jgi:periplasmic protein TonB
MMKYFIFIGCVFSSAVAFAQASMDSVEVNEPQNEILVTPEVMPEYPGGMMEMYRFIYKKVRYPKSSKKLGHEGTVYIQFTVELDGSITGVKTIQGIDAEMDAEAERVVRLFPKWRPGTFEGKPMRVRFVIPMMFRLKKKTDKK